MSKYIFSTKDKRGGGVGEQGPPLSWLESNHILIKAKGYLQFVAIYFFQSELSEKGGKKPNLVGFSKKEKKKKIQT